MSCFKSASANVESGTTGPLLVVKVNGIPDGGIIGPTLEKGKLPYDPKNVFPILIIRSAPGGNTDLDITHNLTDKNEFDFVELFCGKTSKSGIRIPITKGY